MPNQMLLRDPAWDRIKDLTNKEKSILKDMLAMMTLDEIGTKYEIRYKTVKFHVYNIYKKLGISSSNGKKANRIKLNQMFLDYEIKPELRGRI